MKKCAYLRPSNLQLLTTKTESLHKLSNWVVRHRSDDCRAHLSRHQFTPTVFVKMAAKFAIPFELAPLGTDVLSRQ